MLESQLDDFESDVRSSVHSEDGRLSVFEGMAEVNGDPNFELLKRHFEMWMARNPQEAKEFVKYRKNEIRSKLKATGGSFDNSYRHLASMPPSLYRLFSILSPNFIGQKEITPEKKRKRLRTFIKEFPVFRVVEKI